MKTLILMRHAKSDWSTPGQADVDRPLNPRGRRSAAALGDWLREKDWLPDAALVSAAKRTRETWEGLALDGTEAEFVPALYHAPAHRMAQVLTGAEGETVLMLGHNPGIAAYATQLLGEGAAPEGFQRYPTGATAVFRFDGGWDSAAELVDFVVPRALVE